MARARLVTRTIEVTEVEIMCVDIFNANVHTDLFVLSGKSEKDLLTRAKELYETDETKLVAIQSTNIKEVLYGMPEADFIRLATILPPRTTTTDEVE